MEVGHHLTFLSVLLREAASGRKALLSSQSIIARKSREQDLRAAASHTLATVNSRGHELVPVCLWHAYLFHSHTVQDLLPGR